MIQYLALSCTASSPSKIHSSVGTKEDSKILENEKILHLVFMRRIFCRLFFDKILVVHHTVPAAAAVSSPVYVAPRSQNEFLMSTCDFYYYFYFFYYSIVLAIL